MYGRIMLPLMLLIMLRVAPGAEAEIFYDEDWESGLGAWTAGGEKAATQTISTEAALTGTHALKMIYPNDLSGSGDALIRYFPNSTHIFYRFGLKYVPGFLAAENGLSKVMIMGTDYGGFPTMLLEMVGAPNQPINRSRLQIYPYDCPSGQLPEVREDATVNPNDGQWHQYEFEFQMNTPGVANGLVRWWIDGQLKLETLNRQLVGPTPSSMSTCPPPSPTIATPSTAVYYATEIYRQSGTGALYLDRVAVGNTRIGLVSSVAPTAPNQIQLSHFVWKFLALLNPYVAWSWFA